MQSVSIDGPDIAILRALQCDASLTNAQLADQVHLSASQCSRRRAALEASGLIKGYAARLNAEALGFGLRAITRINLRTHGGDNDDNFVAFIRRHGQIRGAFSVSGDADYLLDIHVRDLREFAEFIHHHLLAHPLVAQVRSEIVLMTIKDDGELPLLR
ncbi:AsnC family transcriptional regulator [Acidiphilium sp. MT5]